LSTLLRLAHHILSVFAVAAGIRTLIDLPLKVAQRLFMSKLIQPAGSNV